MNAQGLILVDLQNDYFPGGRMELEAVDAAAGRAARLLRHFRDRALPVFHVRHVADRPGASFFLPGTPGADIHPTVAPSPRGVGRRQALPQQLPGDRSPGPAAGRRRSGR